ncbi:MAG: hypothetical protein WAN65_09415 [Candidatus Sulfotelmatobacter sp.]
MTMIHVPRPDLKSAMDRNRRVNTLLKVQIERLHEAEMKLPAGMRTETYINAIKTEGEAADYVRAVTEAIHVAHEVAAEKRTRVARPVVKRRRVIEIAAVAEERPVRKRKSVIKGQKKVKDKRKSR